MKQLFIYISLFFSMSLHADNLQFDIYTGNKYYYTNSYQEVKVKSLNLYEAIDYKVDYFVNMKDTIFQKKFNEKLFKLGFVNIDSAGLLEKIKMFHDDYIKNYIEINSRRLDSRGEYSDNIRLFSPLIEDVDLNILAVCNNVVTIERVIRFKSKYEDLEIEKIEFRQMFYFDIRNMREYKVQDFFLASSLAEFNQMMSNKIIETYTAIETTKDKNDDRSRYNNEYDDDNDDEEYDEEYYSKINKQNKPKVKQLKGFSAVQTGYWVYSFPNFKYCIPEYDLSTQDFKSEQLVIKIQYDMVSKFISPITPLSFIKNPAIFTTKMMNRNHINSVSYDGEPMIYDTRDAFNGINHVVLHIDNGPKIIKIYSDKQSNEKTKTLQKELHYNQEGYLIKMMLFNSDIDDKLEEEYSITYSVINNVKVLQQVIGQRQGKLISKSVLTYDKNGNVLKIESYALNDDTRIQEFFYNDSMSIMVDADPQENNQNIDINYYCGNTLCKHQYINDGYFSLYTYKYDKLGNILYSYEESSSSDWNDINNTFKNLTLYAYNDKNQLLSYEFDGNSHFYLYDEQFRCFQTIYNGRDNNEAATYIAIYDNASQISKVTWLIGGSTTPMVFTYEYQ